MHLQHLTITKFWGEYLVDLDLNKKMNIIIGKNGTGKTQILNLIEAALTCEIDTLYRIDFDSIELKYSSGRKSRILRVEKSSENMLNQKNKIPRSISRRYAGIVYFLDDRGFLIVDNHSGRSNLLVESTHKQNLDIMPFEGMKDELSRIFNTVVLNVHRSDRSSGEEEISRLRRVIGNRDALNDRIESILNRITSDQVKLKDDLAIIAKEGEKQFVSSLLFTNSLVGLDLKNISGQEMNKKKELLIGTMTEMGIIDPEMHDRIELTFEQMSTIADKDVGKEVTKKRTDPGYISNIFNWMSLLSKLESLGEVSSDIEKRKKLRIHSWDLYISKLCEFMGGKNFDFDGNGKFKAFVGNRDIDIAQLSSGEKQIFVMLSEAYLENREEHLFLADEPELSLHLEWQQNILPAMNQLNGHGQYIIVTHSPKIAGSFPDKIIDIDEAMQ